MKYDLHRPCKDCPFRSDKEPFIAPSRAREILTGGAEFACHMTVKYGEEVDEEGEEIANMSASQHCAGVLILLEKEERPHQMMRICERIGIYDARKLDMDAPVYDSIEDAVRAHRKKRVRA